MGLRFVAYGLNVVLLGMGVLSLLGGGICGAVVTFVAGGFNLFALIRGETDEGPIRNIGLFANTIAFIYGIVALFQAWGIYQSDMLGPTAAVTAALITAAMAVCLLSAGIVTLVVFARDA